MLVEFVDGENEILQTSFQKYFKKYVFIFYK